VYVQYWEMCLRKLALSCKGEDTKSVYVSNAFCVATTYLQPGTFETRFGKRPKAYTRPQHDEEPAPIVPPAAEDTIAGWYSGLT
jgi:hypothetical protein